MSDDAVDRSEGKEEPKIGIAELARLEGERIEPADAVRSFYDFGDIFFDGHGWIVIAEILAIVAGLGLGLFFGSVLPGLLGIAVAALLGWYAYLALDDWVADHNAEVDRKIRAAGGDPESGRRRRWIDD
jgi:hypothetical protein